jgi:hypothetical protein
MRRDHEQADRDQCDQALRGIGLTVLPFLHHEQTAAAAAAAAAAAQLLLWRNSSPVLDE